MSKQCANCRWVDVELEYGDSITGEFNPTPYLFCTRTGQRVHNVCMFWDPEPPRREDMERE